MLPDTTYFCYKNRWNIEPMFALEKNTLNLNTVNVHGDYRLYASEFINFLSSIIGCRIRKLFNTTVLREIKPKQPTEAELSTGNIIDMIMNDKSDAIMPQNNSKDGKGKTTKRDKSQKTKKIYVADAYSYPEVLKYLSRCKCVKNDSTGTWSVVITIKYIEELTNVLGLDKLR